MRKRILASSLTLCAAVLHAQSYTCPDEPTWSAISCSMHEAIQPTDWDGFDLTFVLERAQYRDYMVTSGPSAVRLRIYHHFDDPDWVAKQLAKAWAGQPRVLRRSAMPFLIGIDYAGPVYWDYTDTPEARHIVEYPAEYVHEYASTLDWAFEEILTHEMCHVIDKQGELQGSGRFSNREGWRRAVGADNDYVSEYARSGGNVEDFAESCAAHILLGMGTRLTDAHRDHIEDTMPNRSAYFAKLFTAWSDLIRFD